MVTRNICPVCGNPDLSEPAYSEEEGWPSDEICSCCGYQFGYDDDSEGITHEQWRMRWIDEGMKWWSDTGRQKKLAAQTYACGTLLNGRCAGNKRLVHRCLPDLPT
jgi:hypothetical protein